MRERQRTETAAYFSIAALRVAGGSRLLTAVFACTAGINLMALTGPAYMVGPVRSGPQHRRRAVPRRHDRTDARVVCARRRPRHRAARRPPALRPAHRPDAQRAAARQARERAGHRRSRPPARRPRRPRAGSAMRSALGAALSLRLVPAASAVRTARGDGRRRSCRLLDHWRATQCATGAAGGTIERAAVGVAHRRIGRGTHQMAVGQHAAARSARCQRMANARHGGSCEIATRGASIGDAGAGRLPGHVRNLPRAGDARRTDPACPRPRPRGVGNRTLAQPGGSA